MDSAVKCVPGFVNFLPTESNEGPAEGSEGDETEHAMPDWGVHYEFLLQHAIS